MVLPLVGREIPIIADEYANPEKGSGAVKITPAHDFNDYQVYKRHPEIGLINIFDATAHLNDSVPEKYRRLDRFAARKRVVADLEELGLVDTIEQQVHAVPHAQRGNAVIEPWLTDQWWVDAAELAKRAMAVVEEGKTTFVPKNWEKTYFEWMRNIQPWCISRQIWWGHQIPAWYGPDGKAFVALDEAGAAEAARAHYKKDVALTRDEDVLDTWFSSALWPFSTLGWPDKTKELKRYYPTSVLVTAFDIIFFWVARMMMMGMHFMKEVPFHTVYIHAIVRDEKGAKMSKSKGNVADPLAVIDEYGADAFRFTLAAMAAQGRDIKRLAAAHRGLSQFRDQAVERGALRRDERVRAPEGLQPGRREGDGQPLDRRRGGAHGRGGHGRHRGLQVQRGGDRRLRVHLGHLLRLVPGAHQADPRSATTRRPRPRRAPPPHGRWIRC